MNTFAKILVLGFAISAAAPLAVAMPVNGFAVTGMDNDAFAGYPTVGSVTFGDNDETTSAAGSGFFSGLASGAPLQFTSNFAFFGIPVGGLELFSFTDGANTFVFNATSVTESHGVVSFTGNLLENGGGPGENTFLAYMTMQNTSGSLNTDLNLAPFNGFFSLLPEPNSMILLGTGLLTMAMVFRKRRIA